MKKLTALVVVGILVLVGVITFFMSIQPVPAGHVAVIYDRAKGGVQDKTLGQGWHLINPLAKATKYPVSTETVNAGKMTLSTKDGKPLEAKVSYNYFIEPDKAPKIYDKFKGSKPDVIESGWLKSRLTEAVVSTTGSYSILGVFQDTEKIRQEIQKRFQDSVKPYGFVIENVTVGTPQADGKTQEALQQTINAQQKVEKAQIEQKQVEVEAKTAIEKAKGQAEAKRIEAQGEAKANDLIKKSISKEITNYKAIEKWDGKTPQVTGGATPFVELQK